MVGILNTMNLLPFLCSICHLLMAVLNQLLRCVYLIANSNLINIIYVVSCLLQPDFFDSGQLLIPKSQNQTIWGSRGMIRANQSYSYPIRFCHLPPPHFGTLMNRLLKNWWFFGGFLGMAGSKLVKTKKSGQKRLRETKTKQNVFVKPKLTHL